MALKEVVLELWALIVLRTLKPCWLGGYGLCCTRIFIVFQVLELGFNWTGSRFLQGWIYNFRTSFLGFFFSFVSYHLKLIIEPRAQPCGYDHNQKFMCAPLTHHSHPNHYIIGKKSLYYNVHDDFNS